MFFNPCRDVCQGVWDPCSYRWIIWSKWEIELCVINVEMVGEAMCLYDGTQWCSVCGEEEGSKNRSLGKPSDQLMCFGYLPSPDHPERPTSEIGFKPAKWNPSDVPWWTRWSDDWQCQKRQTDPAEWGLMIWNQLLQFAGLQWQSSAVSVEWPLLKPDCLASSLWKKQWDMVEDYSFECFDYEWKERARSVVFYKRSV